MKLPTNLSAAIDDVIDYLSEREDIRDTPYGPAGNVEMALKQNLLLACDECNKSGDAPARECSDCGERRTESCGSEDCTFDVEQAHIIRPCPCCGSPAAVQQVERGKDKGAYFIECTNPACALTTNLIFAAMDDPLPILREKWNRRSPPLDSTPDPALKPFDRTHGAAGVPGCSESGTNSVSDSGGVSAIAAERARQMSAEGWTPEHDDEHDNGSLAGAAASYALVAREQALGDSGPFGMPDCWDWDREWWKPKDQRRNLVRAGALIAAEIDRLDRAAKASPERRDGPRQVGPGLFEGCEKCGNMHCECP